MVGETSPVTLTSDLDDILKLLRRHHPHVRGQSPVRRHIERRRIEHALRVEAGALNYTLFSISDRSGRPHAGAVAMVPKEGAIDRFVAYGTAPMFFGFLFGFKNMDDFSLVFSQIGAFGAQRGRLNLIGPMEATINHSIGLAQTLAPFPPSFLMPQNPLSWNGLFEQFGFIVEQRLFTFEAALEDMLLHGFRSRSQPSDKYEVCALVPPFSSEERGAVVEVFNSGWRDNWGFVPLDNAGVRGLEKEFRPLLWPGLSYIARVNGAPAAIAIAIPDLNEISVSGSLTGEIRGAGRLLLRRRPRSVKLLILGLAKPYHRSFLGVTIVERLILKIADVAQQKYGATHLQMGWTLESNAAINHIIQRGAPDSARAVHRVWRLGI